LFSFAFWKNVAIPRKDYGLRSLAETINPYTPESESHAIKLFNDVRKDLVPMRIRSFCVLKPLVVEDREVLT